jgi:hypothetical protein
MPVVLASSTDSAVGIIPISLWLWSVVFSWRYFSDSICVLFVNTEACLSIPFLFYSHIHFTFLLHYLMTTRPYSWPASVGHYEPVSISEVRVVKCHSMCNNGTFDAHLTRTTYLCLHNQVLHSCYVRDYSAINSDRAFPV